MEKLIELYKAYRGCEPHTVEQLSAQGSNRCYVRFTDVNGLSLIGCIGTSVEENRAFIYLSRHFCDKKLPVPEVLKVSHDGLRYIQTDLGRRSLFDALCNGRQQGYGQSEIELLQRTISELPRIQILGADGLDYGVCYPQPSMDETNVLFDLNYFKYCFLKTTGVDFHELRLEQDFRAIARDIARLDGSPLESAFLYRDFQARNIMLDANDYPYFIDYQGGRQGAVYYDLASFLWQASAKYPQSLRDHLIDTYIDALQKTLCEHEQSDAIEIDRTAFNSRLRQFVLFRLLQVLGAYGFRGKFERKQHFIDSIPPALDNLSELLQHSDSCPYPYLRDVLSRLISKSVPHHSSEASTSSLTVRVFSFSYKRGIPEDDSGNGGGYVFDCRSTHNPGRYEPYKKLTGLDAPVIKFLEDDGEITTFLQSVYRLADAHVERYIQRGFTSLMFCFGCTGGQHRSVYSAQHLAEHLHSKYGVRVELTHREQDIHCVME
ncbi:MAG: phosphotransferase [Bacteroidaceae bacterium]|nr:phosphotransferase [Bacteroidaceae bacterium]